MKIKQSLVFPFMVWMENGGHGLSEKKGHIVMRKSKKSARIIGSKDEYLEMNDYAIERYRIFLKQWLNAGVSFLNKLEAEGNSKILHIQRMNQLEVLKWR